MQQTTYIDKMLQTVSSLPKEDLAEMAESLIYLTYLKKKNYFRRRKCRRARRCCLDYKRRRVYMDETETLFQSGIEPPFF